MHNFLIVGLEDEILDEMCEDFIQQTFGDTEYIDDIRYDIRYYEENLGTPDYDLEMSVEIVFDKYKYIDGRNEERSETIGVYFVYKGLQAFYMDGKFEPKVVYEVIALSPIQKHDSVYGIEKYKLSNMFYDFMTTC